MKALIGEDDAVAGLVLKSLLQRLNVAVDEAGDGDAVVCMCRKTAYDIIFLDMNMPKKDGFAVLRTLRDITKERGVYIPVVAVTAETGTAYRERCLSAGLDNFLTKPVSFESIQNIIAHRRGRPVETKKHHETQKPDVIFDPRPLLKRLSHDHGAFRETLEIFLDSFEARLRELKANTASKNMESIYALGHTIKGMCRTIGAFRLGEIGLSLERFKESCPDYKTVCARIDELESTYFNDTKPRIQASCTDPTRMQ